MRTSKRRKPKEEKIKVEDSAETDSKPVDAPSKVETEEYSVVKGVKREHDEVEKDDAAASPPKRKEQKLSRVKPPPANPSPSKATGRKARSATSNSTAPQTSPSKAGPKNQKITKFFGN